MRFQQKMAELRDFLNSWEKEVRAELKIGDLPPNLLRDVLEPLSQSIRVRDSQRVKPGLYQTLDERTQVNVVSQDLETGLIVVEMLSDCGDDRFQTMSPGIFFSLFESSDAGSFQKSEVIELYKASDAQSESVQKQHLKEREESFSWKSISTAFGKMAERYTEAYDSLVKENFEALKADYLEFLFLAFVLGNRLGFSPRHRFHDLYVGVFSLTDATLEECNLTMKHYEEELVETAYEEIRLFDPLMELAPPVTCFVTYSVKDQVGRDKLEYPRNCFMPSQQVVSKLSRG